MFVEAYRHREAEAVSLKLRIQSRGRIRWGSSSDLPWTYGMMSAATSTVTANFTIPPNHPALPGHFPGNPVVPGVVILDHVIRVLEASGVPSQHLRKLKHVKFIEPLLPDQEATVTAEVGNAALSFSLARGGRTIARGTFEIDNGPSR